MPDASRSYSSDRSLLVELHRGEEDAATKLYLRYADRLRALALRQTASDLRSRVDPEDIVQSVFRTFFRRAAVGHYQVPEGEELWKLFLVIALNKIRTTGARHHAQKRDARATHSADAMADQPGEDETSLTVLNLVIEEMLAAMPDSNRQIIKLRIAGHEVDEIARQVDRSKRSVERVLQDFRAQLGKSLAESE